MKKRMIGLVLLLAMTAVACGGGTSELGLASLEGTDDTTSESDGTTEADEPTAEVDADEAMLELAACLREQGFDVQDPELDDDGFPRLRSMFQPLVEAGEIDREEVAAAMEQCSEFVEAITTEFERPDRSDIEDQLYEYAACMRDNGFEMADPDFDSEPGQGQGGGPFGALDFEDPEFQAAHEVCQDLFVGGPGGGPGGGGGPRG